MTTKSKTKPAPAGTKPVKDYLNQEFVITREFNAPRKLVFEAWTNPQHLGRWWGPRGFTNPVCEWDAKPGNKIHVIMRAPNGADYPMGGQFKEIAAPERLVFTSGAMDENGGLLFEFLHTAVFTEHKRKTTLTLTSRVTMSTPGAGKYIGGFEAGMGQSLDRLAEQLETAGESASVVVERTIHAPVARVWKALTNVDDIHRWFFDLKEFKAKTGFKFEFTVEHNGFTYCHECKITEVIPEKRIAYTWQYTGHEGNSLVRFELVADGKNTRLKLTHEGLETFPKTPWFDRNNFFKGWTFISGALKEFLESPTADREIVISRVVDAPRKLVWEAMTNPKHVVNWWGPRGFTSTIEKMDFRVGGSWKQVMHGPDGANYPNEHVFQEIKKPERIVFSHGGKREGGPSVSSVATWTFEALAPKQTKVTIHMVFPTAEHRDFVVKEFHAIEGGQQTLERLGEYLARM